MPLKPMLKLDRPSLRIMSTPTLADYNRSVLRSQYGNVQRAANDLVIAASKLCENPKSAYWNTKYDSCSKEYRDQEEEWGSASTTYTRIAGNDMTEYNMLKTKAGEAAEEASKAWEAVEKLRK